ncbi:MAG TPA: hypothetical protein VGR31_04485 [Planctomycetota bacterium]|jgi:hypothetical protein|nr:hypothetical protein [Planctomycetota bacterium]
MADAADPVTAPTWEARLSELHRRLRAWRVSFETALEDVRRERGLRGWFKKPRPEDLRAAEEEAQRRAGTQVLAELSTLFDELCDRYPVALPQERATIRARIGADEEVFDLFWSYVEAGPSRVRRPGDEREFRRGLVAVAIDDMRTELHLIDAVLGRLLVAAEGAGIEWRPVLAEIAHIANRGAGGGGACMRTYMEEFPSSTYFRVTVAEAMREATRKALAAGPRS